MTSRQLVLDIHEKLIVDLFAGGGGMSLAFERAFGRSPDIAVNHDDDALSMHRMNHPQTRHFAADVFEVCPRAVTQGRPVGWLHGSPDCRHHSQAAGGQPRSKKIRGLGWVLPRWAGQVRPDVISMENVKQMLKWGPLVAKRDPVTGRCLKRVADARGKWAWVPAALGLRAVRCRESGMKNVRDLSLFETGARLQMTESIDLTVASLIAHGMDHEHWVFAWSGGKDSTATLTLILWMIDSGRVPAPKRITVLYADTRQELPPLAIAALEIMDCMAERGICFRVVRAPLAKRFMPYILGRGVPPPNNNTLRWCTRQIKVDPMTAAIEETLGDGTALVITGVRQGESAIRDRRIEMSCSKDGAECGQGWYQQLLPESKGLRSRIATLAPILHWRVCHVWEWLRHWAPLPEYGEWPTEIVADAYGGDEAEEINARTGCVGCPLAQEEKALEAILIMPRWQWLAPLRRLKPIYRELREPGRRLRKSGAEKLKNGSIAANPQRMGPLTIEARQWALSEILGIQLECNAARPPRSPLLSLIDSEEEALIRDLISAGTWPDGWCGDEPRADEFLPVTVYANGAEQHDMFGLETA